MKTLIAVILAIFTIPSPSFADGPYAEWTRKTAHNFYVLLTEYDPDQDGCVDPTDFQELLQTFIMTAENVKPKFTSLCFQKHAEDDYSVWWTLSSPPKKRFRTPKSWTVYIDPTKIQTHGQPMPNFSLKTRGGFRLTIREHQVKASVAGIGVNLTQQLVRKKIPKSLLRFKVKSAEINDNGEFKVKVKARLGIPVTGRGDYEGGKIIRDLSISILGIKFRLQD